MLQKVQPSQLETVLKILRADPARSMFILGDIEQNGLHTDYQTTWIDIDDEVIHAIYLKYHGNFVFYLVDQQADPMIFVQLLQEIKPENINAVKEHFGLMIPVLKAFVSYRETYLCDCPKLNATVEAGEVRKATADDAEKIAASLVKITEFNAEKIDEEERAKRSRQRYEEGKIRGYLIEKDHQVVAYAQTSVETSSSAMVTSVFCLPEYRGQGYAKQVVWKLTDDCLRHGLLPCLFYDNPSAGRIYHGLGYTTFDTWVMAKVTGDIR